MTFLFNHEKLEVYQESLAFVVWLEPLIERLPPSLFVRDRLDRAGTWIPLNIAESDGRFAGPDRCRFLEISRGSALECAAALDVLVAQGRCHQNEVAPGKERLCKIVSILAESIKTNSDYLARDGR